MAAAAWWSKLPSSQKAARGVLFLSALNIIFACALAGVVATQLDNVQVKDGAPTMCVLNVKGQVCVFTYISAGEIMLMSLLIIIPILIWNRKGEPLYAVYFSLALFNFFWQLVMAITIQIRGNQATAASFPGDSSRTSAWAFAWIGVSLSFLTMLLVLLDIIKVSKESKKHDALLGEAKSVKIDSVNILHTGVGVGYSV